jgi:hypothetical protein
VAEEAAQRDPELQIYPSPIDLPRVEVKQIWHERTDADPLRRWFRQQIHLVSERTTSSTAAAET